MMHFPSVLDYPLFSNNFQTARKIFPILPFPQKNSIFIRQNFWLPFLVIDYKFWISPLFSLFQYISSSISRNFLFPPTFPNFPHDFVKFTCFLHIFCVFRFPLVWPWCIYASHQGYFCNKIGLGAGTHFQTFRAENIFSHRISQNILLRKSRKSWLLFFAFSLYFRLLPTFYSTFCSIQLSVFRCIPY